MLTVNLIGAGKVAKTLGCLLVKNRLARIGSVFNRSLAKAQSACEFIGAGEPIDDLVCLSACDISFVAVSDDAITAVAAELLKQKKIASNSILVHFSGVISSEVFSRFSVQGIYIASLHPLKGFADPAASVASFSGTFCGIEGDKKATDILTPLFEKLGAIVFSVDADKKPLYHAACIFASNYTTTLFDAALQCYQQAGVTKEMAVDMAISLMQGTLNNLKKFRNAREAMTGPIARADTDALALHVAQLEMDSLKLYAALGEATVDITGHEARLKRRIKNVFIR